MRLTELTDAQIVRPKPDLRLRTLFTSPGGAGDTAAGTSRTFAPLYVSGWARLAFGRWADKSKNWLLPGSPASCLCAILAADMGN